MKLAIFAEGTDQENTAPERTKGSFTALWTRLAVLCGASSPPIIKGFSKKQIRRMFAPILGPHLKDLHIGPNPDDVVPLDLPPKELLLKLSAVGLDKLIAETFTEDRFDRAIIALDLEPKHNALPKRNCRAEVFLLLESLRRSRNMPPELRRAAGKLKDWYWRRPASRGISGPRYALDIMIMSPCFESLLIDDEAGLLAALGHTGEPPGWPNFKRQSATPDRNIFLPACKTAPAKLRAAVGDPTCADKHLWALHVLEKTHEASQLRAHEIFVRLQQLLSANFQNETSE